MLQVKSEMFEDVNKRIDELTNRIHDVCSRFDYFTSQFDDVINRMNRLEETNKQTSENYPDTPSID